MNQVFEIGLEFEKRGQNWMEHFLCCMWAHVVKLPGTQWRAVSFKIHKPAPAQSDLSGPPPEPCLPSPHPAHPYQCPWVCSLNAHTSVTNVIYFFNSTKLRRSWKQQDNCLKVTLGDWIFKFTWIPQTGRCMWGPNDVWTNREKLAFLHDCGEHAGHTGPQHLSHLLGFFKETVHCKSSCVVI